jgi:hypothetical protein
MTMKYIERIIPKTSSDLRSEITVALGCAPTRKFPTSIVDGMAYYDFDGIFYSIERGIENLRKSFGDVKADQLLEMLAQAKMHYETGGQHKDGEQANSDNKLGAALMTDIDMLVADRQPWAYPKELYRWHVDLTHPEQSDQDFLDEWDECS